ncbi:ARF GTPase-activating protein GIT1 isoform X1 [Haemaphysalis longicornis]
MIGRLAERTCRPAVQTSAVTVVCVVPCHEGSYVWLLKFVETAALPMVHSLHASGANAIWEHQLLEPGQGGRARRKPSARDSLHPVKSEFIRAKHQNLAFVHRAAKEGEQPSQEDLSKQLHASVRTANLETSLRLLAQGALPSQLHPEKGSTALHVAARGGQACQVELLLVYGADPTVHDARGHTPADAAREAGHADLEARLVESQYEVTDRLAWHLSGRSPEHQLGQHFILPEMADCLELSARAAKQKLQSLGERLFGELARDLYDEVDRRECEATWMGASTLVGADRQAVPFLPVSPELSSTRNQARQKLARLTARELATLLIDILCEAKRRHLGAPPAAAGCREQRLSDDEPLYDSVASDEDSHALGRQQQLWQRLAELQQEQASLRLAVEALQATVRLARMPPEQGSVQRSPRPQSMCEWRHLGGSSQASSDPRALPASQLPGGAGADGEDHAGYPGPAGLGTGGKPGRLPALLAQHPPGGAVHECAVWQQPPAGGRPGRVPVAADGQRPPAAALGRLGPRGLPAHPGCLRGGQGRQAARPGLPAALLRRHALRPTGLRLECTAAQTTNKDN